MSDQICWAVAVSHGERYSGKIDSPYGRDRETTTFTAIPLLNIIPNVKTDSLIFAG